MSQILSFQMKVIHFDFQQINENDNEAQQIKQMFSDLIENCQRIIIVIKIQPIHMPKQQHCAFCKPSSRFQPIMTTALFEKYSTSSNFYFSRQIDDIINNSCTEQVAEFHQILFEVNNFEFLKRQYAIEEFSMKIQHYSEYYKFNRDVPRCFDKDLLSILMRYQERLKKIDFRKVKNAIKKQQGISITSHHTESSIDESGEPTGSQFGNVLSELRLQNSSDSIALNHICAEIGTAFGKTKINHLFKGTFEQNSRNFEAFLEKQRKKSICYGKPQHRNVLHNNRQQKPLMKGGHQFFKLKPLIYDKKTNQKHTTAQHLSKQDKIKREKNEKINSFRPFDINRFSNTLQHFYKLNASDKYQSIKSKNVPSINKKMKSKSFRKSQNKKKTPNTTKLSREQKNIIDTERFHRDDSKKTFRKNSTIKTSTEKKNHQMNQNKNAFLANQIVSKDKNPKGQRQSKSLSKSKSRAHLSKEGLNCQSSKRMTRAPSNLTENSLPKIKVAEKPKEINKMNNLINKKLALYIKC